MDVFGPAERIFVKRTQREIEREPIHTTFGTKNGAKSSALWPEQGHGKGSRRRGKGEDKSSPWREQEKQGAVEVQQKVESTTQDLARPGQGDLARWIINIS